MRAAAGDTAGQLEGGLARIRIDPGRQAERHGLLAAIYGTHEAGLDALKIPPEDAAFYGFAARDEADNAILRRLWAVWVDTNRADAASYPPR